MCNITMLHLPSYIFKVEGCYKINILVSVAKVMGEWLTQVWLNLQVKQKFYTKQLSIDKINEKMVLKWLKYS